MTNKKPIDFSKLLSADNMVMMALEGIEKILRLGETAPPIANGTTKENYTDVLDVRNQAGFNPGQIGSLVGEHKSPQVSKRAGKIWRDFFVECAICRGHFSTYSTKVRFSLARFSSENTNTRE